MNIVSSSQRLHLLATKILELNPDDLDHKQKIEALKDSARSLLGQGRGAGIGYSFEQARLKGREVNLANAIALHKQVYPIIADIIAKSQKSGQYVTWNSIARTLDQMGIKPPRTDKWGISSVRMIWNRTADWNGE